MIAFALESQQGGDPDGRLRLVVRRAAAVEVAVLFEKYERVDRPILAPGLDHVDVGQQQDRLARARAAIAHHHVGLGRDRAAHKNVGGREAGGSEAGRDRLGDGRGAAGGEPGLHLDHLLVDLPRQSLFGFGRHGVGSPGTQAEQRNECKTHCAIVAQPLPQR